MGRSISKLYETFSFQKQQRILMLGLDLVGKRSILFKIKFGDGASPNSMIQFNLVTVEYKCMNFTVWDVVGHDKIRVLWRYYYNNTQGLIFVVDSSDKKRIDLARDELQKLLLEYELRDVVLLVLANKQDLGVMGIPDITEKLGLHTLKDRIWYIQGTCAHTGEGIHEGLDWLSKAISNRR